MASGDLRDELNCSICLSLYTDSVSLRCGHNFCRSCIVRALDTQDGSGGYSCPDCRERYSDRPPLKRNRKLDNIVERFISCASDMEETRIFCTYCTESPVPAVKSCLQCENSLCDDHLTAHNNLMNHILIEPTNSFGNKRCPIHKKVLEYYCPQDAACLCVSCCLVGEHRGHQVELLDEASEKKKKKLRKNLDELKSQKSNIPRRVQNLQDHQRNIKKKASDKRESVCKLFMGIKHELEMAEKKALSEISRQEEKIVSRMYHRVRNLAIKDDDLSRKMRHLEKMCLVTDPIKLLQESDITVCSRKEDGEKIKSQDNLDEFLVLLTLHRSLMLPNVTSKLWFNVPDILLDEDTAHSEVKLSEDLKTATQLEEDQDRPESPGRFMFSPQVLSKCSFSSGRHYWEIEWNQEGICDFGVSYASIEKEGEESSFRENDKAWVFVLDDLDYGMSHDSLLGPQLSKATFGVFLDYEAGRLSFYELCDPIKCLDTTYDSFTEPLHFALYVEAGASVTIKGTV